jgi:hypothetical protein
VSQHTETNPDFWNCQENLIMELVL